MALANNLANARALSAPNPIRSACQFVTGSNIEIVIISPDNLNRKVYRNIDLFLSRSMTLATPEIKPP